MSNGVGDQTVMNVSNSLNLKKLMKRRSTFKATATKFSNFLNEYKIGEPNMIKLNVHLEKFVNQFRDFDEVSDQIELLDENPELIDESYQIEETYLSLITLTEQLKLDSRPNQRFFFKQSRTKLEWFCAKTSHQITSSFYA